MSILHDKDNDVATSANVDEASAVDAVEKAIDKLHERFGDADG